LHFYIGKIVSVKLLNAIGKGKPAKIILIKLHVCDGGLQQPFIHTIAESIVTGDRLGNTLYRIEKKYAIYKVPEPQQF
jgi:hypothetical protein